MNRWALRLAYFGQNYYGFQRQPNLVTIEGRLLDALDQAKVIDLNDLRKHRYATAARTDRGVSALEQTIAFDSAKRPNLSQLNAYLPNSIWAWAIADVPRNFHPQSDCRSKTYVYYYYTGKSKLNLPAMQESAAMLEGTHDFQAFARYDPKREQRFERVLSSLKIVEKESLLLFQFSAKAFLWEQCRRIVSHLLEVGLGQTGPKEPNGTLTLLSGKKGLIKPSPAASDGLLLFAVDYDGIIFHSDSFKSHKKSQFLNELCGDLFRRYKVVEAMQRKLCCL
ncbi:MAG: tRNA pseudouridine(38-40) synthase TruA [Candidatus Hodarchaeales archaeon]|jgi:tRNA pseudouridine38-40 synthase